MRLFAWTLTALCALTIGCNKPVETIPAVTPEPVTSGTTLDEADHDHDHADHDHADGDHADHDHAEGAGHDEDNKVGGELETVKEVTDGEAPAAVETPAEEAADPSASNAKPELIRFVADKRIKVPTMMCPYSCWPTVQETLAAQPGVEAVQLAEQPAGTPEGEIKERVVELKLNGKFDAEAAIAALEKVSFKGELAN